MPRMPSNQGQIVVSVILDLDAPLLLAVMNANVRPELLLESFFDSQNMR